MKHHPSSLESSFVNFTLISLLLLLSSSSQCSHVPGRLGRSDWPVTSLRSSGLLGWVLVIFTADDLDLKLLLQHSLDAHLSIHQKLQLHDFLLSNPHALTMDALVPSQSCNSPYNLLQEQGANQLSLGGLNASEQRELEQRMQKRQVKEFVSVRLSSMPHACTHTHTLL